MRNSELDYPKIRYVEAFPVETPQGQLIGLRDPTGIATDMIVLSPDVFFLLQFFDGRHSQKDLRYKYFQAFGSFIYEEQLAQIVDNLDEHFFLENNHFQQRLRQMQKEFMNQPVRKASHAGKSYPEDPKELKQQLENFFTHPQGAGLPNFSTKPDSPEIGGIVVPHIDLRGGGPCYSHAYRALAEASEVDCFIILGTGHSGLRNLYSVLAKDFETPFGVARHDKDFIQQLKTQCQGDYFSEVLPHKSEHTIEFQLIFLQYLFQQKQKPFTFVPILCSFSYHFLDRNTFPEAPDLIDDFTNALQNTIESFGRRVCLIASVDFSHVGVRYGDRTAPDLNFMTRVKEYDQELIKAIEQLDAEAFYRTAEKYEDRYRVCGFAPIYTLLRSIKAKKAKLLKYADTIVDPYNSRVTFASIVLFK